MSKNILHVFGICAGSILLAYGIFQIDYFGGIELKTLDLLIKFTPSQGKNEHIAVVAIDDETINTLSWPITRDYYISLLYILNEYHARSVVFDIAFIDENRDHPEWDTLLAQTTADTSLRTGIIHSFYFTLSDKKPSIPYDDKAIQQFSLPASSSIQFPQASSADKPFSVLVQHTRNLGHFQLTTDKDGIFRRVPLFIELNNHLYPSISLLAAKNHLKSNRPSIRQSAILLKSNERNIAIPVDKNGNMCIFYSGSGESFETISLIGLLHRYKSAEQTGAGKQELERIISGKTILVGNTATALGDYAAIPTNNNIPKVYVHANATATILDEEFFSSPPLWASSIVLLLLTLLVAISSLNMRAVAAGLIWLSIIACYCCIAFFAHLNLVSIPVVMPLLSLFFSYICVAAYTRFFKEKQVAVLESALGKYVSPKILEKINTNAKNISQAKQERELTILFSDIKGFARLCSTIDKEIVHSMLTEYFNTMSGIIVKHCGIVDKYIGDGIMSFFDSEETPRYAFMAVRTAMEMLDQIKTLNKKWQAEKKPEISIRIGINTGIVIIGDMGSENFSDYTLFGNEVNIAQRMQSVAEPGTIYVSRSTYEQTINDFEYMNLGKIIYKNIPSPIESYKVVGRK